MLVGSNDGAKVYLNWDLIYNYGAGRDFVEDQDAVTGIVLNAGLNALVFKVVNEWVDWKGSIRFTDAQGNPVKGIHRTLDPDAKKQKWGSPQTGIQHPSHARCQSASRRVSPQSAIHSLPSKDSSKSLA